MSSTLLLDRISESLEHTEKHWTERHRSQEPATTTGLTIAITREAGTPGTSLAREVGQQLGWPVYDHELVEKIALDMGLRSSLVESVDERNQGWLLECLHAFASSRPVTENGYVRHLIETVLSLGTHGKCLIVGRGAAFILPAVSTLRVRLVAPLEHRIATLSQDRGWSRYQAASWIATTDRERRQFVRSHFSVDPLDPLQYDLVLNTAQWPLPETAELVVRAVRLRELHQA